MRIIEFFKFHSTLGNESNKYEDCFVRFIYNIFFFLQKYPTISSLIRSVCYYIKKEKCFHKCIIPLWVCSWLIGIIVLYFTNLNNIIVVIFYSYRLWEILIVNLWMFLFPRESQSISKSRNEENNVRFIFLLIIQYFTLIFCFAGLNRYIYSINSNSFKEIYDTSITWLYHSVVTLTTLGYGDIVPNQGMLKPQISIICETLFGMLFILLFLNVIIKQLNFRYKIAKDTNNKELYCFIDLETTGSDYAKDYPIQIGAILVDIQNFKILKKFSSLINIPEGIIISEKAKEIHGLKKEDLKNAPKPKNVLKDFFSKFGTDYAFAGWNVCFDVSFFRKICIKNGFNNQYKEINFHHLDVQSIARYLKFKGNIEGEISLITLCEIYNLKRLENHDALEDAKLSLEVLKRLCNNRL
ncbi:MAG: exonuclease domain-containing protein [Promethearchaeota archaeon]